MTICSSCKETDCLTEEPEGIVCNKCGAISDSTAVQWEKTEDFGQRFYSASDINKQNNYICGLRKTNVLNNADKAEKTGTLVDKECIEFLDGLCVYMKVPGYVKEASRDLFLRAAADVFYRFHTPVKKVLASVCLYIQLRMEKYPVTIKSMSLVTGCDYPSFGGIFRETVRELGLIMPSVSIENFISSFCDKNGLDSDVEKYMITLASLFSDLCLSEIVIIDAFMPCLAYIAYMAKNILSKPDYIYRQFCRDHGLGHSKIEASWIIYRKMISALKIMAYTLPWIDEDDLEEKRKKRLKAPKVLYFIDDILSHQLSILNEFMQKTRTRPDLNIDAQENNVGLKSGQVKRKLDVIEPIYNLDNVIKRKRKEVPAIDSSEFTATHDLNNVELVEEDLSPSEESLYVKTDRELESIKFLMNVIDKID